MDPMFTLLICFYTSTTSQWSMPTTQAALLSSISKWTRFTLYAELLTSYLCSATLLGPMFTQLICFMLSYWPPTYVQLPYWALCLHSWSVSTPPLHLNGACLLPRQHYLALSQSAWTSFTFYAALWPPIYAQLPYWALCLHRWAVSTPPLHLNGCSEDYSTVTSPTLWGCISHFVGVKQ